eukprot:2167280-Pyramimonas_sp.AAC.1
MVGAACILLARDWRIPSSIMLAAGGWCRSPGDGWGRAPAQPPRRQPSLPNSSWSPPPAESLGALRTAAVYKAHNWRRHEARRTP